MPVATQTLKPGTLSTKCDSTWGYESDIYYTIKDQLGTDIPTTTGVNESWTTGVVNDYSGTNWLRGSPGGSPTQGAVFYDKIQGAYTGYTPAASCTGADSKVDHWGQEWWVGSQTSGSGTPVQTDTLQKYIDRGDHESIVSPVQ